MKYIISFLIGLFCITSIAKELTVDANMAFDMVGVIDEQMENSFIRFVGNAKANKQKELVVLINSPGGLVISGASIIDTMLSSKIKSTCIVRGLAASMAAIFLEYCDNRYSTESSLFMFHQASGGFSGNLDQMKSRLDAIIHFVNHTDEQIIKRLKLTKTEYITKCLQEWWISTGTEAKKQHVIDDVVELSLQFDPILPFISPKYDYDGQTETKPTDPFNGIDLNGVEQVSKVTH